MKDEREKWTFKYRISAPTQDPFLLIDFQNESHTILFDCGVRVWGHVKTILKLRYLFISHAHMDHLIGFDHIVRALLGETKHLMIFGPRGIRERLASKLNGYDWDRAIDQKLTLEVREVTEKRIHSRMHECCKRFKPGKNRTQTITDGCILNESNYSVYIVVTDHGGSPSLAYILKEKDYFRIDKQCLADLGLTPGKWVGRIITMLEENTPMDTKVDTGRKLIPLGELKEKIIRKQPGKKIVYLTDTIYSPRLVDKLNIHANGADLLVCESTFLHEDAHLAARYHHMTAYQAATIAQKCGVRKLKLFHLSNRYFPKLNRFVKEARTVFPESDLSINPERSRRQGSRNHQHT